MSKIKVGVLGAYRGLAMIRFLMKYEDAELVAVCDKFRPALDKVRASADELGLKIALYEDFDEFLKCDMDAVVLANYATEHAPFAIRCLKSGRHVLSEVMAVQTLAEAVELVETVEKTGLVYGYAENFCYFRTTMEMKLRYRRGDIGELTHAEGEYIHDCTASWPRLTYGDPNHWRNRCNYSTFYISHALGPIISITDLKPTRIVGFENQINEDLHNLGNNNACAGLVVMQMENGAMVKALRGHLKREPVNYWTCLYGTKGCMEADRWGEERNFRLNVYIEGEEHCKGSFEHYEPKRYIDSELSRETTTHFGADFYTGYFFLEKILGREDGQHSIDVYHALDMSLPGLLAYRSILNGNKPIDYIDFRDPKMRDLYRNDILCVDPKVAGDKALPQNSHGVLPTSPENFEKVRKMWEAERQNAAESGREK
ncbi:MAG: Gfo/Idh/MocA family oxidoreductase [Oscillibacter sp.]|nr:Gfo/Idh/MocA family oxidoreductase [Oscillibacter sp.]